MPEEVFCEGGKPPLHLWVIWFAAQQFLHAELQMLLSMQGLGLRGQGEPRVPTSPHFLPNHPQRTIFFGSGIVTRFCYRGMPPPLLSQAVTKLKRDAAPGADSSFQRNIIYKAVIVLLLT